MSTVVPPGAAYPPPYRPPPPPYTPGQLSPPPAAAPPPPRASARPASRPVSRPGRVPSDHLREWLSEKPQKPAPSLDESPWPDVTLVGLRIMAAFLIGLIAQVTIIGTLKHNRDQQIAYDDLRLSMAEGTTPVGPANGDPIAKGTPIARITIPAIGVKEVVLAGTSAGVLRGGAGHRRDTVLPGQTGTSIVVAHRMSYGGPFSQIAELNSGDTIDVVTGQGPAQFRVIGIRHAGDRLPQAPATGARLTLITSTGNRFAPNEVVRVDADLMGTAFSPATPHFTATTLPADERIMAQESGALAGVVGWGIVLVAAAMGSMWLQVRWGRWQSWLASVPTLGFLGITVADFAARLLPNLI